MSDGAKFVNGPAAEAGAYGKSRAVGRRRESLQNSLPLLTPATAFTGSADIAPKPLTTCQLDL
jgi:hypothetical protein